MASVVALGPKSDRFYEVELVSRASQYIHDRRVFDQLLKSWSYTGY